MPESRYDTPEYQEFLKQQEGTSGPEAPEGPEIPEGPAPEEGPEIEVTRTGETAQEETCPGVEVIPEPEGETPPEEGTEEGPKADRSKLQY